MTYLFIYCFFFHKNRVFNFVHIFAEFRRKCQPEGQNDEVCGRMGKPFSGKREIVLRANSR